MIVMLGVVRLVRGVYEATVLLSRPKSIGVTVLVELREDSKDTVPCSFGVSSSIYKSLLRKASDSESSEEILKYFPSSISDSSFKKPLLHYPKRKYMKFQYAHFVTLHLERFLLSVR